MRPFTRIVVAVIALSLIGSMASGEIMLKKKFWSGWNYSTDSVHWEKVGFSGNGLKMHMSGNDEALKLMDSYTGNKTGAAVFGAISGFCIGWWLGGEMANKEDNDATIAYVGVGFMVPALILEGKATSNLKAAVEKYNGPGVSLGLAPIKSLASSQSPLGLVVSYRF